MSQVEMEVAESADTIEFEMSDAASGVPHCGADCMTDSDSDAGTDGESDNAADYGTEDSATLVEPSAPIGEQAEPGNDVGEVVDGSFTVTDSPIVTDDDGEEELPALSPGESLQEWAMRVYNIREQRLKIEVADLALEQARAKANAKTVTGIYTDRLEALEKLVEDGWQEIAERRVAADRAAKVAAGQSATVGEFGGNGASVEKSAMFGESSAGDSATGSGIGSGSGNSDAWRDCTVAELQAHGLSRSLVTKLVECEVTTVGRLEDLRSEIALGREKWPKGIGEAKITMIENAVIGWLSANRDRDILASVQRTPVDEATSEAETVTKAAETVTETVTFDGTGSTCPTWEQWERMAIQSKEGWLRDRAAFLEAKGDVATPLESESAWELGRDAFQDGKGLLANDYQPGTDRGDDWLRGYAWAMAEADKAEKPKPAKRMRKAKAATVEESATVEQVDPAPAMPASDPAIDDMFD